MRNRLLSVLVLTFITASAAAAAPQLLSTRTPHYDLSIERSVISPDQVVYDVAVKDLDRGAVILKSHLTGAALAPVSADTISGDVHVHVRLSYTQHFFSLSFAAVRGNTVIDESRTWWQLEPQTQSAAGAPAAEGVRPHIEAPGAFRVGGDVKAPTLLSRVDPIFPEAARRDHIGGMVVVEALIGKDGRVKDAIVLKGAPGGFNDAALDAVRQWEFKPATKDGEPVDVIFNLTMNFKLDSAKVPPPPQ